MSLSPCTKPALAQEAHRQAIRSQQLLAMTMADYQAGSIYIYIRATLKHVRLTLVFLGFPRRVALPSLEILVGEWKFQLAFQARWTDVYLASLCVHRHYSDTPDKATHSTSSSLILLVGLDLGSRHADPASAYPSAFTRVSSTVAPVACRWCPEEARDGGARHA